MADKDTIEAVFAGFFWGAFAAVLIYTAVVAANGWTWESTIVRHGGAHYEMDPATGRSTFHWNDEKKGSLP